MASLASLLGMPLLGGCATTHSPAEVRGALDDALRAAHAQHEAGQDAEAAQLLESALRIDPELVEARDLRASLSPDIESLFVHPWLGSNFARRPATERSLAAKVFLYLPDRILDLVDIMSFDAHIGTGIYVNYHMTRALQAGAGFRGTAGLGWHDHRSLGGLAQAESGVALVALGAQAFAGSMAGSSGVRATADTMAGLHQPSDPIYQQFRDYWAIGESLTLLLFGLEFDLHPVELADFVLGWATLDILNDDFAHTRGLRLNRHETRLIERLSEMERSEETMERFRQDPGEGEGLASPR